MHSAVWKALYNFKIKRAKEARYNHFFFQNVQNNEIFKIYKMFKTNRWISVYYTKSKHLISLTWNFVPRLIQICRIPWWCSLFQFSTRNTFLGKFGPKNQNCQRSWYFVPRLIWICGIVIIMIMFTFSVFDHEYLSWANLVQKFKIVQSEIWYKD